jgi:PadR family transcriptional regulator, regulatory protein AphA
LSSDRLTPFSYVILTLVGRNGAGPHDLRRNAEHGRMHWDAAPSQFYAEPKRLAKLGYLEAEKQPGRTRERTYYTLTEKGRQALVDWSRTPCPLPRIQNEPVVRLLGADLVPADATLEGLAALRAQIEEQFRNIEDAAEGWSETAPHRVHLLNVNQRFLEGLLRLKLEWLDEAEATLRAHK